MSPTQREVAPVELEFDVLFDALPDISLRDQRDALE